LMTRSGPTRSPTHLRAERRTRARARLRRRERLDATRDGAVENGERERE
jgi:hypothetical protein